VIRRIERHASLPSTNTRCFELGEQGAQAGTLVVAETQTAGRGRRGRSWLDGGGDLLFSLLLRPRLSLQRLPLVTLAAGVGLAEVTGHRLKWPNDLVTDEDPPRKLAGILAELSTRGGEPDFVVLGVGLNITGTPEVGAGHLQAAALGARDRQPLLDRLVLAIEGRVRQLEEDPPGLLAAWRERAHTLGRAVRIDEITGIAVDLRDDGALIIETGSGLRAVLAGDVEMLSGADRGATVSGA
jgi:BirA family biotin operon repressor/biotin-[acetyl-CoA-carboxylase] ligase